MNRLLTHLLTRARAWLLPLGMLAVLLGGAAQSETVVLVGLALLAGWAAALVAEFAVNI